MRALLVAFAVLAAAPAYAAGAPKASSAAGQHVDLQALAIPVVRDGRLVNYVFVQIRLSLSGKADPTALRAKAPYFRDALVKAAHRRSFADPKDPTRVDEAALQAAAFQEATRIAGPGLVASAKVTFQNPQRRTGLVLSH